MASKKHKKYVKKLTGDPDFGHRLRQVRTAMRLNQAEAAQRIGGRPDTWSMLERGEHSFISLSLLQSICKAMHKYRMNVAWLITGDGAMEGPSSLEGAIKNDLINDITQQVRLEMVKDQMGKNIDRVARLIDNEKEGEEREND